MSSRRTIYLAMPTIDFGTTLELSVTHHLTQLGYDVVSPNTPEHQAGYNADGMTYFEGVVRDSDALAFVRFDDHTVGAGVEKEIQVALDCELPVFELASPRTGVLPIRVYEMPEPVLSVEETRDRLNLIRGGKLLLRRCPDCQGMPELNEDEEGPDGRQLYVACSCGRLGNIEPTPITAVRSWNDNHDGYSRDALDVLDLGPKGRRG